MRWSSTHPPRKSGTVATLSTSHCSPYGAPHRLRTSSRLRSATSPGEQPRHPEFPLITDPSVQVHTELDDSHATITSGALSAHFARGEGWGLEFLADGKVLTTSGNKALALMSTTLMGTMSVSSSAWELARSSTDWVSGSVPWRRTAKWSTSGTPTAAPAASRRTKMCRST